MKLSRLARCVALLCYAALGFCLLAGGVSFAQESAPPRGSVSGIVTNGTAGGSIPDNLRVFLVVADDTSNFFTQDAVISREGAYRFEDVPLIEETDYTVVAAYRERIFQNTLRLESDEQVNLALPLTIYELTEEPTVITITDLVIQVDAVGDRLEVQQFMRFENRSDRAFTSSMEIGDNRYPSVVVSLPPGAEVVGLSDTDVRFVSVPERYALIDTNPVLPKQDHTIALTYLLPYDNRSAIIEQELHYGVSGSVRLLVWPESLSITSELDNLEAETIGEKSYQVFQKLFALDGGLVLGYEVRGSSAPGASQPGTGRAADPLPLLLLIVAGGVILIGAVLSIQARQRAAVARSDKIIDALMRELAELDEQHRSGQLNHDLWHHQRAQIKARLNQLTGEEQRE